MIASLYAGISGLSANATAMTVIGDNIANVNTTAFKGNRSHFANILSSSLGGESATGNVGRGVEFWGTNAQWTQGSLENSSNPTDLAINGKGFFMVQDGSGSNFYTRAGSFTFDKEGYLVNPDGLKLQGYQIDADGNIGAIESVYIPGERISAPSATERVQLRPQPERRGRRPQHLHDLPDGLRLAGQCHTRDLHVHENCRHPWCMDGCRFCPGSSQRPCDDRRGRHHAHHLRYGRDAIARRWGDPG